jgi:hypothetical protein
MAQRMAQRRKRPERAASGGAAPKKAKRPRSPYLATRTRQQRLFDALADNLGGASDEDLAARPDLAEQAIRAGQEVANRFASRGRGKGAGHVDWHGVVRELVERERLTPSEVLKRFHQYADGDHDVIDGFVKSNADAACDEVKGERKHPPGKHFHCRNRNRTGEKIVPVSVGTVKNFVSSIPRPT